MRWIVFVTTLIVCSFIDSKTGAATIEITRTLSRTSSSPAPPNSLFFQASNQGQQTSLAIPDLPADPPERILNYSPDDGLSRSWLITEANAGDYGFDWDAFEAKINGEDANVRFGLGTAASAGPPVDYPVRVEDFEMDRIEIDLDYWFWHPVLPGLRALRAEGRIFGEGRIVPEPTGCALAVCGMLALGGLHCRRVRAMRM